MPQIAPECPKHGKELVERGVKGVIQKYPTRMRAKANAPRVDLICPVMGCEVLSGPECPHCKRFYRIKLATYKNPDLPKAFYCPRECAAFNL